jgi:RND family efflux transporter MFP subunit
MMYSRTFCRNLCGFLAATFLAVPCLLATEAPLVRYTEAREHDVRPSIRMDGTIESTRTAVIASEVAGVVEKLLAHEGQEVRRGQPIAQLRVEPMALSHRAAQGELAEAQARLHSAELRLERIQELAASEVVSRQNVDDASYEAEALRGRVAQLEAEVERLARDLAKATVRAAFDGVVGDEMVQPGEWLDVGAPVVELISVEQLEIRLAVPEKYFAALRTGVKVDVTVDAQPGERFAGTVRAVVPRADVRSRTFPVLVRIDNEDHRLGAGMLARVELLLGDPRDKALLVPKDALLSQDGEDILFVLDGGETATVRRLVVEVGSGLGSWMTVEGDLEPGARVVIRGNERLADGQQVRGLAQEYPAPGDS